MKLKALAASFALIVGIVGSLLVLCRQTAQETRSRQAQWLEHGTDSSGRAIASVPVENSDDGARTNDVRKIPDGYVPH